MNKAFARHVEYCERRAKINSNLRLQPWKSGVMKNSEEGGGVGSCVDGEKLRGNFRNNLLEFLRKMLKGLDKTKSFRPKKKIEKGQRGKLTAQLRLRSQADSEDDPG